MDAISLSDSYNAARMALQIDCNTTVAVSVLVQPSSGHQEQLSPPVSVFIRWQKLSSDVQIEPVAVQVTVTAMSAQKHSVLQNSEVFEFECLKIIKVLLSFSSSISNADTCSMGNVSPVCII